MSTARPSAAQVLDALDAFLADYRQCTALGCKQMLHELARHEAALRTVCDDSYVRDRWLKFESACRLLAREQLSSRDRSDQRSYALGDLQQIRERMVDLGLLP